MSYGLNYKTQKITANNDKNYQNDKNKKQYYNKLFKKGKLLVKILDFLDKNHCQKSMKEF